MRWGVGDGASSEVENLPISVSGEEQHGAVEGVAKERAGRKEKKTKTKSKSKSATANLINHDDPDVDLDEILKDLIVENEDLYARILRYEPIKFDVFLALTTDKGINPRALKPKLRNFLDAQCINFHSSENSGSRTRYR